MCVCVCVRVRARYFELSICQCHQFIFVVALHFGLFYLTNYKKAVFMVSQIDSCGFVFVYIVVQCHQLIFVVVLHFGLFYLKRPHIENGPNSSSKYETTQNTHGQK